MPNGVAASENIADERLVHDDGGVPCPWRPFDIARIEVAPGEDRPVEPREERNVDLEHPGVPLDRLETHQRRLEDHVAITAHRGSSHAAPENTLSAIRLAVEEGADVVEIDVQLTRDGEIVVAHDETGPRKSPPRSAQFDAVASTHVPPERQQAPLSGSPASAGAVRQHATIANRASVAPFRERCIILRPPASTPGGVGGQSVPRAGGGAEDLLGASWIRRSG